MLFAAGESDGVDILRVELLSVKRGRSCEMGEIAGAG